MSRFFYRAFVILSVIFVILFKKAGVNAQSCNYGNALFDSTCRYCVSAPGGGFIGCSSTIGYTDTCNPSTCTFTAHTGTCNFVNSQVCTGNTACVISEQACSTGGGGGGDDGTPPGDGGGGSTCSAVGVPSILKPDAVFDPNAKLVDWTDPNPSGFNRTYELRINDKPFTTGNSCVSNNVCTSSTCSKDGDACRTGLTSSSYSGHTFVDDTKYNVKVRAKNDCSTSAFADKTVHACLPFINDPEINDPTYNQIIEPGSYTVKWGALSRAYRYVVGVNDVTSAVNDPNKSVIGLDCNADGSGAQFANDQCIVVNSPDNNGQPSSKEVSGFAHNRYYNIRVQAFRCAGFPVSSGKSPVIRVLACNGLAQPGGVVVDRCGDKVTWDSVTNATGYEVTINDRTSSTNPISCDYSKPNGAKGPNDACIKVYGVNNTSVSFDFKDNHEYTVKVKAFNQCREGPVAQRNISPGSCDLSAMDIECSAIGSTQIKYQWNSVGQPYWLQADTASPSANTKADGSYIKADVFNNGGITSNSVVISKDNSGKNLVPGTTYWGHVRQNSPGKQWSPSVGCPLPTPTLYPTIAIQGDLRSFKKSGPTCQNITPGGLDLSITAQGNPPEFSSSCSRNGTNYTCTAQLNNQQNASVSPAQLLTLNATSTDGYAPGYWVAGATNACVDTGTNTLSVNFATGPYDFDRDILFPTNGWIKLKDASFAGLSNGILLANTIPSDPEAFDADDTAESYFIIGEEGVGTGKSAPGGESYAWSQRNWHRLNSTFSKQLSPLKFYEYIKARREYVTATLDTLQAGKINLISTDITLNEGNKSKVTSLNQPTIIMVLGKITISAGQFNDVTDKSLAFLATDTISFENNNPGAGSDQQIKGIFIGQNVTFDSAERAIKIVGNVVAVDSFDFKRERDELKRPSLFIVHQPRYFIDLLPLLAISTYDWRQLQ